jgi:hypothetical protein
LADLSIDFIRDTLKAAGGLTEEVYEIFFHLFIEREEWTYDESGPQRGQFSALVEGIPSEAGQARVLELLTTECPGEPHYWNHRGRHLVYSDIPNYRKAEEFLLKAVELSEGKDALHFHALGLVRRFWIQQQIRDLRIRAEQEVRILTGDQILESISVLADAAFNAFEESRKLRPDVNHGYITHVQTVLYISEALHRTGGEDFASVSKDSGAVGLWLRNHLATAEELMIRLTHLRGQEPETGYEIKCFERLAKLYGRFELIDTWESQLGKTSEPQQLRRALASLYLARRDRRWSSLPPGELRRIVELTEANLRGDPANERDLRLWFQAMRRLPEFNYYEAIDRLEAWASRTDSVDAHFYLYILHFLRWRSDEEDAEKIVNAHLEACTKYRMGARGYSFEWLAKDPDWCPLLHASELGDWDPQKNFFSDTRRLAFATGTIESIRPQAGRIRLGRVLRAFFVPPADIREAGHLNARVHFHLGFSYEGFRAWSVQLGEPPESIEGKVESQQLWVGGVPHRFTDPDITALFQPFGPVERVELPRNPAMGGNRGFCLVTMVKKEDAAAAIKELHGRAMEGGRRLHVREAISRA